MQLEFETSNNKDYKIDSIWKSTVFVKKSKAGLLSEIYLSSTALALTFTLLPNSGNGNEKLSWLPMS